jgi:tetratricopeptide (TPR) repeat protein
MFDQLGLIYLHLGLFEEALEVGTRAKQINPLSALTKNLEANALFWKGDDAGAVQIWKTRPKQLTWNFVMRSYEAVALVNLGRTKEADDLITQTLTEIPKDPGGLLSSARAFLLARQGDEREALKEIEKARKQRKDFGHSHHALYNLACAYALLNQQTNALECLHQAAGDGFPCYPFFKVDKNLKNLRQNPKFVEFLTQQEKKHEDYKKKFSKTALSGL